MIFLTTTAIKIDEELLNRCLVLSVDEDREQTRAIHQLQRQRQTLQGLLSGQDHLKTLALHRNAQRLLRPLLVANPFAEALTFLDDKTRTRRDHVKYLTLIRAVTLLHQHQRPVKTVEHQGRQVEYIEVTLEDIEIANRLANEVLGRAVDDLPPQTRRLLGLINEMVTVVCQRRGLARADYRFSRRDVREHTGWGHTQLQDPPQAAGRPGIPAGAPRRPWSVVCLRTALRDQRRGEADGRAFPGPAHRRGAATTRPVGFATPSGRGRSAIKSGPSRGVVGPCQWRKPCQFPNRLGILPRK